MAYMPKKYIRNSPILARDARPLLQRFAEAMAETWMAASFFFATALLVFQLPIGQKGSDLIFFTGLFYIQWFVRRKYTLPMRMPAFAKAEDFREGDKKPKGILFVGNENGTNNELWMSNTDARTHILYLGTTGSGKTEGLKSLSANALTWGSGFIYIDGKSDTYLWASLFSLARRFGRDDDIFVLNYLTGNSDYGAMSNTINPFASGSAPYLTNLLVSLMDEAKGENAMWKGRAVALMTALMPALTYKRDFQNQPLSVRTIQENLSLQSIVRLSRDVSMPERITRSMKNYLQDLPGFIEKNFDDNGDIAAPGPNDPPSDVTIPSQQHGFLTMQFTRALLSLGQDYWYIFNKQLADITMQDVVLNRRILVVLIPSLEKSGDEAANLGKIVSAMIKGMMGTTLGSSVEGDWATAIDNKPTNSASPFLTIFDEVGYYTAQGMAVMAAQARSLGFALVFASQDIPSMELRVKEEAKSITANCNLKIFGKLEEAIDTRNFFEKTVCQVWVTEVSNFTMNPDSITSSYVDGRTAAPQLRARAAYMDTRDLKEGEVFVSWKADLTKGRMFYANPKPVKAMRVHKFLPVEAPKPISPEVSEAIDRLVRNLKNPDWSAAAGGALAEDTASEELAALQYGFSLARQAKMNFVRCGSMAVAALSTFMVPEEAQAEDFDEDEDFRRFLALDDDEDEKHAPGGVVGDSGEGGLPAGLSLLSADIDEMMKQAAGRLTSGLDGGMAGSAE